MITRNTGASHRPRPLLKARSRRVRGQDLEAVADHELDHLFLRSNHSSIAWTKISGVTSRRSAKSAVRARPTRARRMCRRVRNTAGRTPTADRPAEGLAGTTPGKRSDKPDT